MKYQSFGSSGLRVSELCLGAQRFGDDGSGSGIDPITSRAIFDAYAEAGGNFLDTASSYLAGVSERSVGDMVAYDRDHFVIASKYVCANAGEDIIKAGASRKNLFRAVDESLRRLRTDHLDILYVHQWDRATPVEEVMRGMDDLVRMGKVHYPAVSNTPAWVIAEANTLARLSGWTPFAGMQVQYSLAERAPERELFPLAEAHGMAVCAWAPLAAGLILRPDLSPGERTARGGVSKAEHHRIAVGLAAIARRLDASAAQLALAWMRYRPGVEVIPVAAADSADQVRENMASLELELSPDVVAELDALTAIDLGYPSTYLSWDLVVNMATAFQPHRLRPPRGRA